MPPPPPPPPPPARPEARARRLLVVMPSWIGDAVMATPALRLLRDALPGAFIGGLMRPGIDEVLAGGALLDEFHVAPGGGVMGPKHTAAKVRPRRYEAALLLTNSFSTALSARLAGIPRRTGYDRDGRGFLLTCRLDPPRLPSGRWAPVSAVAYYLHAARAVLGAAAPFDAALPPGARLELGVTPAQQRAADEVLARAVVAPGARLALLNPGANDPAKRWPADRFAAVAGHLASAHGLTVLVNGSPGEAGLAAAVVGGVVGVAGGGARAVSLAALGITIGSLKGVLGRCAIAITNDTGPRHLAAALGVPVVSLFGPTDPRWTAIPTPAGEAVLRADPTLPEGEVADDHPQRCRIDRIEVGAVAAAADALLGRAAAGAGEPAAPSPVA